MNKTFFLQTLPYCHSKESLGESNDAFTREKKEEYLFKGE
jgi:hypothetical protein